MNAAGQRGKLNTARMTQIALMTAVICVISPWVIVVPFSPVPLSFSLFAVLLAAYLLGAMDGCICCGLYLLLGGLGLPVFSGGVGGPGKLLGPTGGYLVGYLAVAGITGYVVNCFKRKMLVHFGGMLLGVCVCYLLGTLWLSVNMDIGMLEGLMVGVVPYLPADLLKMVLVCILGRELRKRMRKGL
ncbi:MAG: biotin transporter BioY [Lachnospiraceae bacterium]|nr:biotin transporter BioY [Lachnospiraceae bacterium]